MKIRDTLQTWRLTKGRDLTSLKIDRLLMDEEGLSGSKSWMFTFGQSYARPRIRWLLLVCIVEWNQSSSSDPCHMVKGYVQYSDLIHQGVHNHILFYCWWFRLNLCIKRGRLSCHFASHQLVMFHYLHLMHVFVFYQIMFICPFNLILGFANSPVGPT